MKRRNIEASTVPAEFTLLAAGEVELRASDKESLKRFEMVAYTGDAMRLPNFPLPVVVDLAAMRVPKQMRPILRDHDATRIVGHTMKIRVADNQIIVAGVISGASEDAREVIASSGNGFPWQASIGARPHAMVEVRAGQSVRVNGKTFRGPLLVARPTTLREVSFVALGADDNTSARVAAGAAQSNQLEVIDMNFEQWLKANGHDVAKLTDDEKTELKAKYEAEIAASAGDQGTGDAGGGGDTTPQNGTQNADVNAAAGDAIQAAGNDAIAAIRQRAAAEQLRIAKVEKLTEGHPEIRAKAIEEGWDVTKTELECLRASRANAPAIHSGNGTAPTEEIIECGLRLGSSEPTEIVEAEYDDKTLEAADQYRGLSIAGLVGLCCAMDGRPRSFHEIQAASPSEIAAAGFSTASLPGILGNTLRKAMLAAYRAVPSAARVVAKKLSPTDFKTHTGYQMTGDFVMKKVGADGELKHATIGEQSFTYSVDTYGRIFGLTRQMIINDDLSAFTDLPRMMGRGAALALEEAFWTLVLANTSTYFGSDNANYISGATTTLTSAGLAQAVPKLSKQTDADGKPILVEGKYLVVPPELRVAADELYVSTNLQSGNTGKQPDKNVFAGKYKPVESPYLSNSAFTGYSTTAWYLFGNPNDVAAFGIAYLNGRETPVVENADLPADVLGRAWRGYFDFGVCQVDHRGAVMSKGAA